MFKMEIILHWVQKLNIMPVLLSNITRYVDDKYAFLNVVVFTSTYFQNNLSALFNISYKVICIKYFSF